ncbi:MAG: AMP phosphorylase [Candidatus Aenigmatarchaeota archaeon]
MKMKIKIMNLDAGGKSIGIINQKDAMALGVHPLDRIVIQKGKRKATVTVDTAKSFVKQGTIVVYNEVKALMNLKSGDTVDAEPRKTLLSKSYIRKKTDGQELNYKELREIVDDAIARNLNDLEMASFVTALHIHGLTLNESLNMSKAMIATGKKVKFAGTVVDKHSIGGVPGDKTSILVVPIVAAAGLTIPKTSSRSITSPAGTADRMEVLAPVEFDTDEIKRIVKKTKGCLVWGGAVDLAPADDLFIRIEHPLGLDPLLLPSVMSKKKSVGCRYLVIDIPTGSGAKMEKKEDAEKVAASFKALGKKLGIKVECAVTRGDQPVGYAIGPALEAREALEIIMGLSKSDVLDKATSIAGLLLGMVNKGNKKTAENFIKNGKAEKKLREIIKAQGGDPDIKPENIRVGPYKFAIKSNVSGVIAGINNVAIVDICSSAGTPQDRGAGILLNKKINDTVKKGETLFTIYSEKPQKLKSAAKTAKSYEIYNILSGKRKMLVEKL